MATAIERIELLRYQGVGLLEAKRFVEKEMLIEQIDAARTVDDLKPILLLLVSKL